MAASKGVALITGCAQGIGRGIALHLADDGLDTSLNDMPTKKSALDVLATEIKEMGRKMIIVKALSSLDVVSSRCNRDAVTSCKVS